MSENPNQQILPFFTRDDLAFGQASSFGLRVDLISDIAGTIKVRGYTKAGIFTFSITPDAVGDVETFNFNIPDVPVAVSVFYDQASFSAPVAHVSVNLTVNGDRIELLCQGTISTLFGLSWPRQPQLTSMQSQGAIEEIPVTSPSAGGDISGSIPSNEMWEIMGVAFKLTTDGTAADRTVAFRFFSNRNYQVKRVATVTQQASETIRYSFVPGGTSGVLLADNSTEVAIPAGIFIPSGGNFSSVTTNIQAGDQYDLIFIMARRHYIISSAA